VKEAWDARIITVTVPTLRDRGNATLQKLKMDVDAVALEEALDARIGTVTVQPSKEHGNATIQKLKRGVDALAVLLEELQRQRNSLIKV